MSSEKQQKQAQNQANLYGFAYHLAAIVAENQGVSIDEVVNAAVIDWAGPLVSQWVEEFVRVGVEEGAAREH